MSARAMPRTLEDLVALLERLHAVPSNDAPGLTEGEHALETAAVLARGGVDEELIAAGLVHDVGHLFGPGDRHAELGAEAVRPLLGGRVAALVGAHVSAKRYLVTTEPSYRARLTEESRDTLSRQGGTMSGAEVEAFGALPVAEEALTLRRADESAKAPGRIVPGLETWVPLLQKVLRRAGAQAGPAHLEGTLVRRALRAGRDLTELAAWTAEVQSWPVGSHRWGHYAERTSSGDVICRTENVSACHRGFAGLVRGALRQLAGEALGDEATDFKDKLNYKQPGGAGFRPHQDVAAYPGAQRVLSVLLAIDDCTRASGCLWVAPEVDSDLPTDDGGVIRPDVVAALEWRPVELRAGDALLIDGTLPHCSQRNASAAGRRVLVASYTPAGECYSRDAYYAARTSEMTAATGRNVGYRISVLADFAGTRAGGAADDPGTGPQACSHPPVRHWSDPHR